MCFRIYSFAISAALGAFFCILAVPIAFSQSCLESDWILNTQFEFNRLQDFQIEAENSGDIDLSCQAYLEMIQILEQQESYAINCGFQSMYLSSLKLHRKIEKSMNRIGC